MITHDIDDVLELADVACVYEDGRVIRQVPLRDVPPEQAALRLGDEARPASPGREPIVRRILGADGPGVRVEG